MLLIACPYCGKRPEIEFTYGGEAHLTRPTRPAELDDAAWAEFLYMRVNTKGIYAERWRHARGCGRFFNALRDTTTDHFLAFYKSGEPRPILAQQVSAGSLSAAVASAGPVSAGPASAASAAGGPVSAGTASAEQQPRGRTP